ncbi:hypothetical protein [Sphingomonas phyllosphaerae]|uniref:hypothetical protein n=1 Tax=Sphingomonas phyllosphaerae TaxID=257003 RepID=UPI001EE21D0E|nr:hypothetical protein [Sphingomonas phyllosphaerae]
MRVIGLAPLRAGSWRRASDDAVAAMAGTKARQDRASIMRLFDPSMLDQIGVTAHHETQREWPSSINQFMET